MKTPRHKPPIALTTHVTDRNLQQFIGYNMKRTFLIIQEDMARTLEPLGLRMMTFSTLAIIIENPDITQTQLAQALGIERSGVVVLVDELENAELISRNKVEGDRRSYALRPTLIGQKLWRNAQEQVHAHETALFAALPITDRSHLRETLRHFVRLTANGEEER